jgi:hypothetical protein
LTITKEGITKYDATISSLVNWTSSGLLKLPEIQRRYVWNATKVRDYLDSLYRGYPTGTILVWGPPEEIETKDLSVIETDIHNFPSAKLLLLDGQQRITSLTALITGMPLNVRGKKKPLDILFNLEHLEGSPNEVIEIDEKTDYNGLDDDYDDDEEDEGENNGYISKKNLLEDINKMTFVVRGSLRLEKNPFWVSVTDIFQKTDKEILKPLGISSEDARWDQFSNRLKKVRQITDYYYMVQSIPKNFSYQEVTQIFVRVNSKGVKLRGHDLAVAQVSSKWKGFVDIIETFAKEFVGEDDYLIDSGIIVRALVAFATKQCKFDRVSKISLVKLKNSFEICKKGLRYSINFVLNNASVGTLQNISSPYLLVPIAVYSILKEHKITKEEERKLLKWFYIAHMRGHYAWGGSEGLLDQDLSSLFKTKNLDNLLKILKAHIKEFSVEVGDITYKNTQSPFFTLLYFALMTTNIKDWETGLVISNKVFGRYNLKQYDHIFPRSILLKQNYDRKEINEMANIAFLTSITNTRKGNKIPVDYFENQVIPKRGIDALKSQLIPVDKSLWEVKNFRYFLEYRRKAIVDFINNFLKNLDDEIDYSSTDKSLIEIENETPYGMLKNLETKLRTLIETKLSSNNREWWTQRVPQDVKENAELKKQKNEKIWPWYTGNVEPIITYLDFNDYLKIIRKNDNWKEVFKNIFVDEEWISTKFKELSPIRNKIAHSRELEKNEIDRLKFNVIDLLSCIKRTTPKN